MQPHPCPRVPVATLPCLYLGGLVPARPATGPSTATTTASAATPPNAVGNDHALDTAPTAAGPSKNPRYAMVVTVEIAPARRSGPAQAPAMLMMVGAQTEVPSPAMAMPT